MLFFDGLAQALGAEELAFAIGRLRDAVGMKHQNIARGERNSPFLVRNLFKNAERKTGELDLAAAPLFVQKRLRLTGIRHAQLAAPFLPRREASGHKPALDAAFANHLVHLAQHFCGLQLLRRQAAHDSDRHRAVERRRCSLAADVTQSDAELVGTVAQKIVQIATDFARGNIARRHIQSKIFRGHRAQQRTLNALGGL